jgi:hypothetical protein
MAQDFLSQLFGGQPDYSQFMTPQQSQQSQSNALTSAGLNAAIALLGASGQTNRPISTGQVLGSALGAGLGGYQSSFDNTLRQMLTQGKLADMQQNRQLTEQSLAANRLKMEAERLKMERDQRYQDLLSKVFVPTPVQVPMSTEAGSQLEMLRRPEFGGDMAELETRQALQQNLPTTQKLDMNALIQALALSGPEGLSKAATLMQPKEIEGMKISDIAGDVKLAIQALGIKDESGKLKTPDLFTPDDLARVNAYIDKSSVLKSPKINISDPTAVATAQAGNVKDYNAQVKDFREVARRYSAMVEAHKDKANPATDATLIYGLAKIYDPAGAVQQGDINTIKGKRSIPESVIGLAEKLQRGGTLTPQERDNVISTAYSIINSYSKSVQPDVDTYRSFSKSFGADPNQIRSPFENFPKPDYIFVTIGNKQEKATLAKDGNYYIQRGDQYYKVSD